METNSGGGRGLAFGSCDSAFEFCDAVKKSCPERAVLNFKASKPHVYLEPFMLLKSGYFSQSLVIALHFLDSMRLVVQGEENPVNVLWLHFGL